MNPVVSEKYTGFTALTVGTTNVAPFTGLTGNFASTIVQLSFEGSAVRFRLDGVSAHSASGHLASANDSMILYGNDSISGFNVICTNTTGTIMADVGVR
jgi:hypothetical protein